jgi:hypothetical protein
MSLAWKQIKVYLRTSLIFVVGAGVVLLLVMNRSYSVRFWFFWLRDAQQEVNVVWLMLCTAAVTLVSWWALSFAWSLVRDWRELKRLQQAREFERSQIAREASLRERERRVDKIKQEPGASEQDESETDEIDRDDVD